MKNPLLSFMIVSCLFLSGCGSGGGGDGSGGGVSGQESNPCATRSPESQNWNVRYCYFYSETVNGNGCDTGKQEFNSLNGYCNGLLTESLNKHCARDRRQQTYDEKCRSF